MLTPCLLPFCDGTLISILVFPAVVILLSSVLAKELHPPLSSSSCRVSVLKHRGHVKFKDDHNVLGFIGGGNLDPLPTSSHGRSVPNWTAEPERTGPWGPPPRRSLQLPRAPATGGTLCPCGFQSSFSPVLPLFLSPTVYCHQFSDGEKKNSSEPHVSFP